MMRRLAPVAAFCLAWVANAAWALGLGDIQLYSALNQPLRAEVALFAVKPGESALIDARIASNEAFKRAGIEYADVLNDMRFRVVQGPTSDQAVLQVTTAAPVREPFVALLLEVSWPEGRLVREFTLLLDPPIIAATRPTPQPRSSFERPSTGPGLVTEPAPDISSASADTGGRTYGPVRAQETLWSIAYAQRPNDSISMDRMMQAIYEANPEAFDGSISRIRAGSMLRIPSLAEVRATDPSQARSELARERSSRRTAPPPDERTASAAAPAPPAAKQPTQEPQGQLKLSPPEEEQATTAPPPQPAPETAAEPAPPEAAEPESAPIVVRDNSAKALELLAEHAREHATRQAAGEQLATETAEAADAETPAEKAAETSTPAEEAAPPTAATTEPEAPASDSPFAEEAPPATPEAAPPPTAVDVTAEEKAPPPPPAEAPQSLAGIDVGSLNPLMLVGLVVLAILLLGIAAVRIRQWRAARQTVQLPPVVLSQAGDLEEPSFASTLEAAATPQPSPKAEGAAMLAPAAASQAERTVETTVETTAARKTLPPEQTTRQFMAVSTPEATATLPATGEQEASPAENDPYADIMGEADIHIAYGLYDEAARLLQDPLAQSPDRKDLHLKLLEVYFSANMAKEFEDQAGKMKSVLSGAGDPDWEKVCIMGRQLCPESKLFAGGEGDAGASGVGPTADLDFTSMLASEKAGVAATSAAPSAPAAGGGEATKPDLDFSGLDLGLSAEGEKPAAEAKAPAPEPEPEPKAAATADEGNTLDFNLDDFKLDQPEETQAAEAKPAPAPEPESVDAGLDIDLSDFDVGPGETEAPKPASEAAEAAALAGGEEGAEDDLLSSELEGGEGQADTRLDLARAYMDMGEPSMAESLLQEVIAQGNAEQKQEAKELLGRLGSA